MNYQPQKASYDHQAKALSAWGEKKFFALLMAMRTGKTKVTIDRWGKLALESSANVPLDPATACQDLMVIAPAGVYRTWEKALKQHLDLQLLDKVEVFTWSAKHMKSKVAKRRFEWFLGLRDRPRVLLINVEALSSVKAAQEAAIAFVRQRYCMVAVDESTTIKNPESKRTEFINVNIKPFAAYRVILCGLPTPRSPLDLYGQFNFLDDSILGFNDYTTFESRYADIYQICMLPTAQLVARLKMFTGPKFTIKGVGKVRPEDLDRQHIIIELKARGVYLQEVPVIKGYRHEEELHEKIMPHSYRVLLKDCYDLPPKIYMPLREVEMTDEQEKIYNDLKRFATAELEILEAAGEHITATHVLTRKLRLHQILCGHTKSDETGEVRLIKENRTREVLNILEEYDGKAIIWCSYDEDIRKVSDAIRAEYGDGSVARFWGGNKDTREEEEKLFLTSERCRFEVATPSAGGRGRTWSNADLLIYYSNLNNLEHRAQSEERGDEVGKMNSVACADIVIPDTADIDILDALREKMDMSAKITGDEWRQWIR